MKNNKCHTVRTGPKSTRKPIERGNLDTTNIQIHDRSLSCLCTGISIKKSGGVMLLLWTKTSPLCEMMQSYKCFQHMSSILSIIHQRLLDQTKQELNSLLEASSKCMLYKYIVSNIDLQFYLQKNIPAIIPEMYYKNTPVISQSFY